MALTAVQTDKGPAYINLERIETISSPFKNKFNGLMMRAIGMFGGSKIYIFDNDDNRERLKDLLPLDAAVLANADLPDAPRARKRGPRA
jgi:hypothetical protein